MVRMKTHQHHEYLLHRVVAGSAFLFALCLLPVVQYVVVERPLNQATAQVGTSSENGQVAGVSTDASPSIADVTANKNVSNLACVELEVQKKDLSRWIAGVRAAQQRKIDDAVAPYKDALNQITGTDATSANERSAIEKLIADQSAPFARKLTAYEKTYTEQKAVLDGTLCLSE